LPVNTEILKLTLQAEVLRAGTARAPLVAASAALCYTSSMSQRRILLLAAILAFGSLSGESANPPSSDAAKAALRKAADFLMSISTEGGYLWRYSADLRERRGEEKATATQIWVQHPGTPSVGMAFLDAYEATRDEHYLNAARAAAMALVRGQLESGGWAYVVEFDPQARNRWEYHVDVSKGGSKPARRNNGSTFDDDNTQGALRFLMAFLDAATNRSGGELESIRKAMDFGLEKMIEAQYPNGAWPQRYDGQPRDPRKYPVRPARFPKSYPRAWPGSDYGGYYTLNDHTQSDCIRTMLEAHRRSGERKYLDAARKGGEFLILAQLPEPQPGWAQQYNFDVEPTWARAFEPPAVCSNESGGAVRMLIRLFIETGDEKFMQPIPAFIAWLKRSQIDTNRWARCYELGSNKPIYGDRDGKIHYTLAEISAERQRGYRWEHDFGIPWTIASYERVRSEGREKALAEQRPRNRRPPSSPSEIAGILESQDSEGRWLTAGWIEMQLFVDNIEKLSSYLRANLTKSAGSTNAQVTQMAL
jgi:hypothetical protein